MLEYLDVENCNFDNHGFMTIFTALAGNLSFKGMNVKGIWSLLLLQNTRAFSILSQIVCDKTSINHMYSSNHTLQYFGPYIIFRNGSEKEVQSLMYINLNEDKMEVAHQKILECHFLEGAAIFTYLLACQRLFYPLQYHGLEGTPLDLHSCSILFEDFQYYSMLLAVNVNTRDEKRKHLSSVQSHEIHFCRGQVQTGYAHANNSEEEQSIIICRFDRNKL